MARLFGTDGVRGVANEDLTAELALDLAVSAAHVLAEVASFDHVAGGARPLAVVARDPRASGEFLSAAVIAGLASAGMDVDDAGVLPTPGLAHAVALHPDALLGVMISASHNPMPDNGVKFFDRSGSKLADAMEDEITERLREPWQRPTGHRVGRVRRRPDYVEAYVEHLVASLGEGGQPSPGPLAGLRVVVDCANGAASTVAPAALRAAGAEVIVIGAEPDGWNINDGCGSTHLDLLRAAVVDHGADAGVAHDGDADRCLAVDATGAVVDGDGIMAVLALAMAEQGRLDSKTVVSTVMSNLGLSLMLAEHGIELERTAVGDRYVLEAMRAGGHVLGGEQSGHIIMARHATTGDGVLTALHLLARVARTGRTLADLASVMTTYPQVLVNVRGVDKARVGADPEVARALARTEDELGATGRVLLRASGTEPVVRVMVEAPAEDQARRAADELAAVVAERLRLA